MKKLDKKKEEDKKTEKKASDDGLLPENPYRSNSKICKGCDFETVCKSKPKGDIKIEPRKDLE